MCIRDSHSGIGEILEIINEEGQSKSYKVAAILEDRPQSFLHFDLLTGLSEDVYKRQVQGKLSLTTPQSALLKEK